MFKMQGLAGHLALLLFFLCTIPCNGNSDGKTVVIFKGDDTDVSYKENSDSPVITRKPNAFRVPAFVGGVFESSEFLAVLCDARYDESAESPFIEPVVKTSKGNYETWSSAMTFGKNTETQKGKKVMGNITAVMKEDKIYALATVFNTLQDLSTICDASTTEWDTVLLVGTVVKSTDSNSGSGYTVTWDREKSLKYLLSNAVNHNNAVHFFGGVGNGVVMNDGNIVFPIQILNKNKKNVCYHRSSIIYSGDNGTTWRIGNPTQFQTSEGSVVEWSDGKLLLSVRLDLGYRVIYESIDMGISWDEFAPFTRVWGNNPKDKNLGSQGSAITVSVNGKNILLVSHPLNTEDNENRKNLQLWVSDGKRISCVGTISEDDKGEQTGNSILAHVGDKLYVTHEINPFGNLNKSDTTRGEWDKVIAVSLLQELFDSAKNTVNEWQQLDKQFENKGIPADSLVGFLGNTIEGSSVWQDMYNCVHATVNNAISVEGGFRFNGSQDSYALWPVQDQGQNQVYKFTDKQFTLAATVIVHNTIGAEEVSVFGVGEGMHTNGILVGLGYTQDRKWITMHGSNVKRKTDLSFELEKEYHIAIQFYDGTDYLFVDGEEITYDETRADSNSSVDFFYMGSTGEKLAKKGSSCTVKNVMLFNRLLEDDEIKKLLKVKMYANTNKLTSTAEPTSLLETQQTVSTTTKPLVVPDNQETVSTTKLISVPIVEENVLITDRTSLQDNDEKVITTKPTSLTDTEETVRTTEPTNLPDTEKPMSTTTSTRLPNTLKTVSTTTKPLVVPDNHETVLTTEPTGFFNNDKTVITTQLTRSPENDKTVPPTESKETAVTKKEERNEASANDKNVNLFQRVYRNTTIEEQINRADGASVPFIFVKVMCFICSIIVLGGV